MELERAVAVGCAVFLGSRSAELDSDSVLGDYRLGDVAQDQSVGGRKPAGQRSRLLLFDRIVSGVGWLVVVRSPIFSSGDPYFRFRLDRVFQRMCGGLEGATRDCLAARTLVALLIAWNLLFMFQWGTHMIPVRGPISFQDMARAQFTTAPVELKDTLLKYLTHRKDMMNQIENIDVQQIREQQRREHPNLP